MFFPLTLTDYLRIIFAGFLGLFSPNPPNQKEHLRMSDGNILTQRREQIHKDQVQVMSDVNDLFSKIHGVNQDITQAMKSARIADVKIKATVIKSTLDRLVAGLEK